MSLQRHISIAFPYGQQLAEKGYRIALPANSDLTPLVRAASPTLNTSGEPVHDSNVFLKAVEEESNSGLQFNEYVEIHGALVDHLVPLVKGHIRITQNAAQFIEEHVGKVEKYKNQLEDSSPLSRFNVIMDPFCDVLDTPFVEDLISTPIKAPKSPESILTTIPRTKEEILLLLETPDSEFNKLLLQGVTMFDVHEDGQPRNFLEDVYMGFFCGATPTSKLFNFETYGRLPSGERALVGLIIYLISDKLYSNVPKDAVGSLTSFKINVEDMSNFGLHMLASSLEEKKYQSNNGLVIIDMRGNENSIVLDKCSFNAFLDVGGHIETILGSKVASLGLFTQNELIENSAKATQAWSNFASASRLHHDNERQSYLVSIFKAVWSEAADTRLDFEEEVRQQDVELFTRLTKEAYEWLDNQDIDVLEDTYKVLEHLFATIRFHYTPAAFFLKEMRLNQRNNPEAGERGDALAACMKYVASYLKSMITYTNVI